LKSQNAADSFFLREQFAAADLLKLSVPERLDLVEDIWNSIAAAPEALELTEEDKRLIDERIEAYHQNPSAGSPWDEVYARIASRNLISWEVPIFPNPRSC
jgi:putative addiction module component (TIGR02574 family)